MGKQEKDWRTKMPKKKESRKIEVCPCCGQKIVEYKHLLNKVLVRGLVLLGEAGGVSTLRALHDSTNMSVSEYANFQKLQYFGLVSKDGQTYLITEKGKSFLAGTGFCPAYVKTRLGIVTEEGEPIALCDIETPVQEKEEWERQASV